MSTNPFLEWDAVPFSGKLQALIAAAVIELNAEQKTIDGGKIGEMPVLKAWLPWIPRGGVPVAKAKHEKASSRSSRTAGSRASRRGRDHPRQRALPLLIVLAW